MPYPGGKNGAGVYQTIISRIPPHRVYIEPFLGGGAIMRLKKPAAINIGLDLDEAIVEQWEAHHRSSPSTMEACIIHFGDEGSKIVKPGDVGRTRQKRRSIRQHRQPRRVDTEFRFEVLNAMDFLRSYPFQGDEFVYCDPPYVHATRGRTDVYRHEMSDLGHLQLIGILRGLTTRGVKVMISGYRSKLYTAALAGWHVFHYTAVNRAGAKTDEYLWTNFPEPVALHDYRYLGTNFRERERIKRKKARWVARLRAMPVLERRSLLAAIGEAWETSVIPSPA